MKSKKILKIIMTFVIATIVLFTIQQVNAQSGLDLEIKQIEYTEQYKKWLEISDEEKEKTIEPRKYEIDTNNSNHLKNTNNVFKINRMLKSTADAKYSLKNVIGDNVKIKNQGSTNSCWAFATIGVLETNLAMQDYQKSNPLKVYDFSERHMVYSSVRDSFLNGQINEKGYNVKPNQGGTYYIAQNYLINGSGAIDEQDMPFENNEDNIDISKIKNKEVQTTIYDTIEFQAPSTDTEKSELMLNMKSHISSYGGIYAGIYGANISKYYNNETGALYCDDTTKLIDHAVLIIGWDDNYSKENFNESHRPQNNGAWIIKNSWGEKIELNIDEVKQLIFETVPDVCKAQGWNSASDIPQDKAIEIIKTLGYTVDENNVASIPIGDNGYIYISYEDVFVYSELEGIKKSSNEADYSKIYQNDILGPSKIIGLQNSTNSKIYLANVFTRDTNEKEYIDKVSIYTTQDYNNCKVYINPNSSEKTKQNLQEVELKDGETVDIQAGYHTIEFKEPIEVTGENFVAVLEFERSGVVQIAVESVTTNGWEYAVVNTNESFLTTDSGLSSNQWQDLAQMSDEELNGNVTLKAFTAKEISEEPVAELANISITKVPNKTEYKVGENFDTTGMEVTAIYTNGNRKVIENYEVKNGNNLTEGQTEVTISYSENGITKTITQTITVTKESENPGKNEEPKPEEKLPKASDFKEVKAFAKNAIVYTYKELNKESYAEMTIEITGIKVGDEEDKYTYYYCISGDNNSTNIKDEYWLEIPSENIKKQSDGTYSITLNIDSRELKNLSDLAEMEKTYLFIKEIAEINSKKLETVNNLEVTADIEPIIYVDDKKVGNIDDFIDDSIKNKESGYIDNTLANKILPNTGNLTIIGAILIIVIIGGFAYYRYKNIDR